jgi:hypothetical protein
MAASAHNALQQSRSLRSHLSKAARTALLPGILAQDYLSRLHAHGYALDALDKVQNGQLTRQLKLALAALLGRY